MTASNRFDRFKGHWFDASFLDDEFAAAPIWENPNGVRSRDVDWLAFLRGTLLPEALCVGIALEMGRIDPPLMIVLPHLLTSVLESVRRSQEAPGFREVAEQLARLGTAARRLAHVAQGGSGKGAPTESPEWWHYDEDDVYAKHIALGLRIQEGRSPFLHPLLQDHLTLAMAPDAYTLMHPAEPEADAKLRHARQSLTYFFKHLHLLLSVIDNAETMTRQLEHKIGMQRRSGRPEDEARNWALVRLMWFWRDVIGTEPRIYARKTRNRVELDEFEPQGCMAFVVANLLHIDPLAPGDLPALERQLHALQHEIPEPALLKPGSRAN